MFGVSVKALSPANVRTQASGTVLGACGTFRRWGLAGESATGDGPLGVTDWLC